MRLPRHTKATVSKFVSKHVRQPDLDFLKRIAPEAFGIALPHAGLPNDQIAVISVPVLGGNKSGIDLLSAASATKESLGLFRGDAAPEGSRTLFC